MKSFSCCLYAGFCAAVTLAAVCAVAESRSCALLASPPSYTFIGGGFHMQLAIEYPVAAHDATFTFALPKSFFIDAAEAEQLYRMETVSDAADRRGTAAVPVKDITSTYTPLQMTSQFLFDIEAPVFKVPYATNDVTLSFKQLPETTALDTYLGARNAGAGADATASAAAVARLVIPIHSRYDTLDTTTPFSLKNFLLGEGAYVHRCLPKIELTGTSDARCGGKPFSSGVSESSLRDHVLYQTCLELPVGLLSDLPYVYHALMGLLVSGCGDRHSSHSLGVRSGGGGEPADAVSHHRNVALCVVVVLLPL
ncbi:hypothetical protein ABB37_01982 [Leptomonas pyrrhocoris]|uniref:Uncharacterized protein n=1 Tax=Leptomonas pyrrhocoris TaxID=157538 RepID=A0A0M9G6T1_LEPPY|nr:hypothetical protein ABB37_01982 [Leptomonas pyrrhocoris]KPA83740.1 hypothetical protein ABB37_01982 [Leptomonas pyrrhocoris]|eukprot:XP_015662179.1 hypothetical protein ABB37_01982 [Leptomonas pyrrhocoris]